MLSRKSESWTNQRQDGHVFVYSTEADAQYAAMVSADEYNDPYVIVARYDLNMAYLCDVCKMGLAHHQENRDICPVCLQKEARQ